MGILSTLGGLLGVSGGGQPMPYQDPGAINPFAGGAVTGGAGLLPHPDQSQSMGGVLGSQGQGQPMQMPIPHPLGQGSAILDRLLLGGALQHSNTGQYQAAMAQYQARQLGAYAQSLSPTDQKLFYADPQGFMAVQENNGKQVTIPHGDTSIMRGQAPYTAPNMGIDDKSGTAYTQTPSGTTTTGQFGGDITAGNGVFTSGRKGPVGTYSQPSLVPLTTKPEPFTPAINGVSPSPGGSAPDTQGSPQPGAVAPPPAPGGSLDPMQFFHDFVLPHEGGLNPHDANGAPTNYGINQTANPGVDVTKLTPDQAAGIFTNKYFAKSGAASLPPALAAMQADTYFINPRAANRILAQAGGDPAQYMALRQQWMHQDLANNPAVRPYAKAWAQRNTDLTNYAASLGGQSGTATTDTNGQPVPPPPPAPGQGAASAAGFDQSVPANMGAGYQIVPGSKVANGNPHSNYKLAPNGDMTEMPPEFGMKDVQANRKAFYDSDQYKGAQAILGPLQSLDKLVTPNAPNGVVQIGINDALNKAFNPGGVIRASTMKMTLNHLGLPADVEGEIRNTFGDGFLTPQIVTQMGRTIWSYAKSHVDQAAQRAQGDQQIAGHFGFQPADVGEAAPPMPPVPKWAQDPIPPPQARRVGQTYWGPRGPGTWTGQGWKLK